jgi:hypothetical protein
MGKHEGSYVEMAGGATDCPGRNAVSHSISHVEGSAVARMEFFADQWQLGDIKQLVRLRTQASGNLYSHGRAVCSSLVAAPEEQGQRAIVGSGL